MIFKRIYPDISEAVLVEFEAKFDLKLPLDYRDFLLQFNGGIPRPNGLRFESCGITYTMDIHQFFGFNAEVDLESIYIAHTDRIPLELVPIAKDPGGDLVYIATTGEHLGSIYLWLRSEEWENGDDEASYRDLVKVADSFSNFLKLFGSDI